MYLFFDTETSGLPMRWGAPVSDLANWPRIVQIAWILCESGESPFTPEVHLIRPDGFSIASGACKIHGISTEFALEKGVSLTPVLGAFLAAVESADVVVAHNVEFDATIVGAEFLRAGMNDPFPAKSTRCTMKETTEFCKLPGTRGYKWPTLTELHQHLFDSRLDGAHDASTDCLACRRCFFRLMELGVWPR